MRILKLIGFILACEILGSIGSLATAPAIRGWYQTLVKSPLNPPNWVFGPVWTLLFALMGIALFWVWEKGLKKKPVKEALIYFGLQFTANIIWSFLFFGAKLPGMAFADIIILWLLILATIIKFYRISKPAGLILIPYLLWVSFASFLNWSVVILNHF